MLESYRWQHFIFDYDCLMYRYEVGGVDLFVIGKMVVKEGTRDKDIAAL